MVRQGGNFLLPSGTDNNALVAIKDDTRIDSALWWRPLVVPSFAASFTVVACSSASATSMEEARKALTTNSNPRCSNNSRAFPGAATETAANVCMANIGTGGKKRGKKRGGEEREREGKRGKERDVSRGIE